MSYLPPPPGTPFPEGLPTPTGFDPANAYAPGPQRWTADSEVAKHTIPYLGPDPPPSRLWARPLQVAAGAGALLYATRGTILLWQAHVEQAWLAGRRHDLVNPVRPWQHVLDRMDPLVWVALIALFILGLVWRMERRPKQVRTDQGEAYVEVPLRWLISPAVRYTGVGLLIVGFLLYWLASSGSSTDASDFPRQRALFGLASLAWSGIWARNVAWVETVKRSHKRRLAWSWPYRQGAAPVPFFPAVTDSAYIGPRRGPGTDGGGAASPLPRLIPLGVVAVGAVLFGLHQSASGDSAGTLWLFIGFVLLARVIRATVRWFSGPTS